MSAAIQIIRKSMHRFRRNDSGVALIEFVLVLPFILLMLFGAVEFSRRLLIELKVQKTSYAIASIVTQQNPATTSSPTSGEISLDTLNTIFGGDEVNKMLFPFGSDPNEGVIISSIVKDSTLNPAAPNTVVKWQIFVGGSISGVTSAVNGLDTGMIANYSGFKQNQPTAFNAANGTGFTNANLATMLEQENMIVVEVFYNYAPLYSKIFGSLSPNFPGLSATTITRVAVLAPRIQDSQYNYALTCLPWSGGNVFVYHPPCP